MCYKMPEYNCEDFAEDEWRIFNTIGIEIYNWICRVALQKLLYSRIRVYSSNVVYTFYYKKQLERNQSSLIAKIKSIYEFETGRIIESVKTLYTFEFLENNSK